MFHLQTIALGFFPFRLHAYKGRDVTHLMDDPIVGDADDAGRRARRRSARTCAAASSSTAGAATRSWRRCTSRRAPQHSALDGRLADPRQDGRVHDAGRGPAPGHEPRRPRRRCARRVGLPGRSHHVLTARARRRVRAPLGAAARAGHDRGGRARARRGSRRRARPGSRAPDLEPMSKHWMGTTRMGADPRVVGVRPVAAAVGRRQRGGRRLVGVPDLDRLRADPHPGRARHPRVARAAGSL